MGQILSAVEERPEREPFFWRQFEPDRTRKQQVFDLAFGVVGPILCLVVDPGVFTSNGIFGEALLGEYQFLAYLISAVEISALFIWLCFERHVHDYGAVFGGIFLAGTAFSTVVGILILPYSLMGLFFIIGLAGFTPFFTSFVYLRNAIKAFQSASEVRTEWKAIGGLVAGLFALGFPVIVNYQISTTVALAVDELLKGDVRHVQSAVDRLGWIPFVPETSLNRLVTAYQREQDPSKKEVLKRFYKNATGKDIDYRYTIFND